MALEEKPVTGGECHLYYNSATHASPTWVEIARAIDVSYDIDNDSADQSSRTTSWKKERNTLTGLEISFSYRKKQGTDTVFDYLQAAALAGTEFEVFVADGASTESGVQGPRAYVQIRALGGVQALANTEEVEFSMTPTYYEESDTEVDPDWYEVPSS